MATTTTSGSAGARPDETRAHAPALRKTGVAAGDPPPRWARRAAALTVVVTLPSALWRMAMAVGIPVGVSDEVRHQLYDFPGWGTVYVFGLSVLLAGLAMLTFGLVQRWGEVVPRWIPFLGSRRVPPLAAVVPAATGALALTLLWACALSNVDEISAFYGLEGAERVLVTACYAPLLLWGPLLAAVTVSYYRRRRRGARPAHGPAALDYRSQGGVRSSAPEPKW